MRENTQKEFMKEKGLVFKEIKKGIEDRVTNHFEIQKRQEKLSRNLKSIESSLDDFDIDLKLSHKKQVEILRNCFYGLANRVNILYIFKIILFYLISEKKKLF